MTVDLDKLCVIYNYICVNGRVQSVRYDLAKTSGWEEKFIDWYGELGHEW